MIYNESEEENIFKTFIGSYAEEIKSEPPVQQRTDVKTSPDNSKIVQELMLTFTTWCALLSLHCNAGHVMTSPSLLSVNINKHNQAGLFLFLTCCILWAGLLAASEDTFGLKLIIRLQIIN